MTDQLTSRIKRIGAILQGIVLPEESPNSEMSHAGIAELAKWEGLRLNKYLDEAKKPTIGVGHLLTERELESLHIELPESGPVYWPHGLTREQCYELLAHDLDRFEACVAEALDDVELTQREYDSLVSFCFNIGEYGFAHGGPNRQPCSVVRALLAGRRDKVPAAFREWVSITLPDGRRVKSPGLLNRRNNEIAWGRWEAESSE